MDVRRQDTADVLPDRRGCLSMSRAGTISPPRRPERTNINVVGEDVKAAGVREDELVLTSRRSSFPAP